ncbi:hypothetical protein AN1V17_11900 [Vallitalea sediminicola]
MTLFKYDVETDGKSTFNIDTSLNENWDKIDNKYKEQENSIKEVSASMADIANEVNDIAYKTVGGSANAITVTKQGFMLTDGQYVEFKATANNTWNTTINVDGLGVKSLRNEDGEQLSSGDIEANKYYKAIYNSGSDFFQLAPRGGGKIEFNNVTPRTLIEYWSTKTNIPTNRADLTSSVVNNKIYVIGGNGGLDKNEEYNPTTNTWNVKANMPTARQGLTSSVVNNKIYVIGGNGSSTAAYYANEEYNPSTNTWNSKANIPEIIRDSTSGVVNNKIYVIGGYGSSSALSTNKEYTPATNTWSDKTAMSRRLNSTSSVVNNKIYVFGGEPEFSGVSCFQINEEYNPSTNTRSVKANMPRARSNLTSSVVNNKIYVIGGRGGLDNNEEYNPTTNTWSTKVNMPTGRSHLTSSVVNNKIYVFGGCTYQYNSILNTNEDYNPSPNFIGYINTGNTLLLNKVSTVNNQFIPANTKTKVASNGFIETISNDTVTGYIQL